VLLSESPFKRRANNANPLAIKEPYDLPHVQHSNQLDSLKSSPNSQIRNAIVSHVQNNEYLPYVLNLGYTIRKYNPTLCPPSTELIVLIPRDNELTPTELQQLESVGWKIRYEEDIILEGLEQMNSNWRRNFIKLRIWAWTEYRKIAFLDADTLVQGDISLLLHDGFCISPLESMTNYQKSFRCCP